MQHLTSEQLKDYGRAALPPLDLLAADDHLGDCVECHRRVAPVAVTTGTFRSLQEAFLLAPEGPTRHLEFTQLAALLDDELDNIEREIVSSHLEGCASCKNELRELSAFRAELNATEPPPAIISLPVSTQSATPAADTPPAAAPVTTENLAQVGYDSKPRNWLRRLKTKFTSTTDWTWVEALVLSLLVLALIFGLFWYSGRTERRRRVSVGDDRLNSSMPYSPPPIVSLPSDSGPDTAGATSPSSAPASGSPQPYPSAPGNVYVPPPLPPQPGSPASPNYQTGAPPVTDYVAQLRDGGGNISLDRQGQLSGADGLSAELQQAVKTALTRQTLEITPPPAELAGRAGTMASGKEGVPFGLLGPLKSVSRTDRPAFHWQPMKGASNYIVTVFDQNFSAVAVSGKLSGTNWQITSPLPRGNVYMWQVAALKDGQEIISPTAPAPEARFKVLEAEYLRDIEQADKSRSRLASGLAYARAGMLREAQQEFGALLRANPDSPVARKLLQTIQKAAG